MIRLVPILLLIALAPGAAADVPASRPASQPASRPAGSSLEIIYTGRSTGMTSSSGSGSTVLLLYRELNARHGSTGVTQSGDVLWQPGRLLLDPEQMSGKRLLDALPKIDPKSRRVLAERFEVLESDRVVFFQYPRDSTFDLQRMMRERNRRTREEPSLRTAWRRLVSYRGPRGEKLLCLEELSAPRGLTRTPDKNALWWGLRGRAQLGDSRATFQMVLKSYGTGPRRVTLFERLVRQAGGRSGNLRLSAGDEVTTVDHLTGKRHPLRDADFRVLGRRYRLHALAPSYGELHFGVAALRAQARRHGLPLVATNLYWRSGKKKGQPIFSRYLIRDVGGVRVGIIGIVPGDLRGRISDPKLLEAVAIRDPLAETTRAVKQLRRVAGPSLALIVALGDLRGAELQRFVAESHGVDVLIGDFSRQSLSPSVVEHRFEGARRDQLSTARLTLAARSSHTKLGQLSVDLGRATDGRPTLRRLVNRLHLISPAVPLDAEISRLVNARWRRTAPQYERVLLPAIEDLIAKDKELSRLLRADPEILGWLTSEESAKWQLWYTGRIWSNVVANVLRRASGAEVAVVRRRLALNTSVPGPIRKQYVLQWLSGDSRVLVGELSGKQLRQLGRAAAAAGEQVAISGLAPEAGLVGGRPVRDAERYRVIFSSHALRNKLVARLLKGVSLARRFRLDGARLVADDAGGKPTTVRAAVLARLEAMQAKDPGFGPAYRAQLRRWLRPAGKAIEPRWTIAAEDITVSFASLANYPGRAWLRNPGMRETRAVTPNNYTLGVTGALSFGYDSARLAWSNRAAFKLARAVIKLEEVTGQDISQESMDDLLLSTELRLKIVEVAIGSRGKTRIVPYFKTTFDTEFTPTVDQLTQAEFSHQKELRFAAGVVTSPGSILEEIRLAALTKADFSVSQGAVEGGLLAGLRLSFPLGRARLKLGGTLRYFPPTGSDTIEDLGLVVEGYGKLLVPFTKTLSLSLNADLFLYRAKLTETYDVLDETRKIDRGTALRLILGAGLTFDHLWKL